MVFKITYMCLACGRFKFDKQYQPHTCNGQFRKHKFPEGFLKLEWIKYER